MEKPWYVVFAGVNGAGKTTLYKSDFWQTSGMPRKMHRINPDEILVNAGGDWRNQSDQIKAGKESLRLIKHYFEHKTSFNQESTLSGRLATQHIRQAKELGYHVVVYYVGVDSSDLALKRIEHRVSVGGHDIEANTVKRRYEASLSNLSNVLEYCDEVYVFDNTTELKQIAAWNKGALCWWGISKAQGQWLQDAILDDAIWRTSATQ